MSKIGKVPIQIPQGVEVSVGDKEIVIKGPKGELEVVHFDNINIDIRDKFIILTPKDVESENIMVFWGTQRALIQNAIIGVEKGYEKILEIVGVGYRVVKEGQGLKFAIGYSHPVLVQPPEGIVLEVEGNTTVKVIGIDKQAVGQVAANIRAIRKPEPYKGKGIRYKDEQVRRKQGKSGKV